MNPYYIHEDTSDIDEFTDIKIPTENFIEDLVTEQTLNFENSQKFLDSNLEDLLSLKIELSQNKIRLSENPQNFAAKITVSENKLEKLEEFLITEETSSATLDIICVIDRSGSMYGRKMAEVKKSLKQLLEILKPTDRIS